MGEARQFASESEARGWLAGQEPGPRVRATDAVLRERLAEVLNAAEGRFETTDADTLADALLPVVARYCEQLEAGRETWKTKAAEIEQDRNRLAAERDQYHAAARHLAFRTRQAACNWATMPQDTIETDAVYTVLMGIASHVPDRPELRDDLWQRIAGAYEARFENDGHPEDARAAADEAMSVVEPELDKLRAERDRLRSDLDLMRVQAKSLSDQLNGQGLRLSDEGLRELGEARTEVRRLHIELAESKADRDRLAAELETMTHIAKVNGEGHRAAYQGGEEARQAVARVRALHQPMQRAGTTLCAHCSGWNGTRCLGVVTPWPCPTRAAVDGTGEA